MHIYNVSSALDTNTTPKSLSVVVFTQIIKIIIDKLSSDAFKLKN